MSKTTVRNALGRRLRALRKARALSQDELAARAGLHRNFVGMLERGETCATTSTLQVLANALGLALPELVDFGAKPQPPSREEAAILRIVRCLRGKTLPRILLFETMVKLLNA